MRLLSHLLAATFCLTACSSSGTTPGTLGGATSLSATPPSVPALIGTWEATGRQLKSGAVGTTLLFSAQGTLTMVIGAMVGGKYRLDGNQLTLDADASGAGAPEVHTVAFAGDTAVIIVGAIKRKLIPFEARGRPNSLVGQWRFIHSAGMPAYEEYTDEGTMRLRIPMLVFKGLYFVSGNTIRMRLLFPRTEERAAPYTLTGDTLTIRGGDGKTEVFVRARRLLPTDVEGQPGLPIR